MTNLNKATLQSVMDKLKGLEERGQQRDQENEYLRKKIAELTPTKTSISDRLGSPSFLENQAPAVKTVVPIVKTTVIGKNGKPYPTKDKACPYCISKGDDSFLDQMESGRWSCRGCGKIWSDWIIKDGVSYSERLERASGQLMTKGVYEDAQKKGEI